MEYAFATPGCLRAECRRSTSCHFCPPHLNPFSGNSVPNQSRFRWYPSPRTLVRPPARGLLSPPMLFRFRPVPCISNTGIGTSTISRSEKRVNQLVAVPQSTPARSSDNQSNVCRSRRPGRKDRNFRGTITVHSFRTWVHSYIHRTMRRTTMDRNTQIDREAASQNGLLSFLS